MEKISNLSSVHSIIRNNELIKNAWGPVAIQLYTEDYQVDYFENTNFIQECQKRIIPKNIKSEEYATYSKTIIKNLPIF